MMLYNPPLPEGLSPRLRRWHTLSQRLDVCLQQLADTRQKRRNCRSMLRSLRLDAHIADLKSEVSDLERELDAMEGGMA